MKPSCLQDLGLFEISQAVGKPLWIIFMVLSLENRHLWTPGPWVMQSYCPSGYREMAKLNQGSHPYTLHLSFSQCCSLPDSEDLSTSVDSCSLWGSPERGGDGRGHFPVCFHLWQISCSLDDGCSCARRLRKLVEASPGLLLVVHTPASETEVSFNAPGDAEPGIITGEMGFSTYGLIIAWPLWHCHIITIPWLFLSRDLWRS